MRPVANTMFSAMPQTLLQIAGASVPVLDPARAALLIIDAQYEYAFGPLALEGLSEALLEIRRLRDWARAAGAPVFHIRHEAGPGAKLFAPGTAGVEFLPEAIPQEGEAIITKAFPNAFYDTSLLELLRVTDRDQLVIAGFAAHMCVESTTRAAIDLGYKSFIVRSATADRALPDGEGLVLPAFMVKQVALASLADRFATILADTTALPRRSPA